MKCGVSIFLNCYAVEVFIRSMMFIRLFILTYYFKFKNALFNLASGHCLFVVDHSITKYNKVSNAVCCNFKSMRSLGHANYFCSYCHNFTII